MKTLIKSKESARRSHALGMGVRWAAFLYTQSKPCFSKKQHQDFPHFLLLKQAFVLLIAVLDIGKLVELLKNDEGLNAESHQLGTASARTEMNKSFEALASSCSRGSSSMGPPLLLAWATFLCLANGMDKSGEPLLDTAPES